MLKSNLTKTKVKKPKDWTKGKACKTTGPTGDAVTKSRLQNSDQPSTLLIAYLEIEQQKKC